jgi:TonB family protein
MFETLVMTKREKTAARTALAFPVAAVFQVVLVGTLLAYSLLYIPAVRAPSLAWAVFKGDATPVVPVHKGPEKTATGPEREGEREGPPAVTPIGIPLSPQPEPQAGGREFGDPNGVDGGIPPDGDYRPPDDVPVARPVSEIRDPWQVRVPQPLSRIAPDYPAAARAVGLEGRVVVQLIVNEEGRVVDAKVLQASNPIFAEPALSAVRQWRFTRPIDAQSNQAVSCYTTVTIHFTMR